MISIVFISRHIPLGLQEVRVLPSIMELARAALDHGLILYNSLLLPSQPH